MLPRLAAPTATATSTSEAPRREATEEEWAASEPAGGEAISIVEEVEIEVVVVDRICLSNRILN